jgi:hypothetical protein
MLVIEGNPQRIEGLLAGEALDDSGFAYDFGAHHLGLIAIGPGAAEAIDEIAAKLNRRPLLTRSGEGTVWAWLGGESGFRSGDFDALRSFDWPAQTMVALGEPAHGLGGWRLTHRQAKAALSVARRSGEGVVRYADVALLTSILRDDLLATSLRRIYLEPLEEGRDGGRELRKTLRAYFAADRNVSGAGAALGVTRQAVARRLRAAEEKVGRSIADCGTELEFALRLGSLIEDEDL